MRTTRTGHLLLSRGPVSVHLLHTAQEGKEAIALLEEAESRVQAPLVDEAERERLDDLAAGEDPEDPEAHHWHPILAYRNGRAVGYAGVVFPGRASGGRTANADLALDRSRESCGDAVSGLLDGLRGLAHQHRASDLVVWVRHAGADDVECGKAAGFGVDRRLLVLGRRLDDRRGDEIGEPRLPEGVRLRGYRPGPDDDAVLRILNAAFEGTVDGDWDQERLEQRHSFDWFDPTDVLLAEDPDGEVAGVHWTKRRSEHLGEVYVLAVAPRFQGTGLGRALLRAGLRHLHDVGMRDVLLWVDEANEPAIGLYRSEHFSQRWTDVALETALS